MMTTEKPTRYWIVVASRDHVQIGIAGGFAQANHGKSSPLKRMKPGDRILYYSSKARFGEEETCQRFTAMGEVLPREVYPALMGATREVNRRDVTYASVREISILPLIARLSFIPDKKRWGAPFRFGMLEIPRVDYELIAGIMRETITSDPVLGHTAPMVDQP
jgi:predicted RNA-binding protein